MTISVVLIDDNLLFRKSVAEYLQIAPEIQIVGQAKDGMEGLVLAETTRPDVVVMDWVMPRMGGLDAARLMIGQLSAIRVIVLTMHADEVHVQNAVRIGACGYVLKEDTVEHLIPAIEAAAQGNRYFSPRIRHVTGIADLVLQAHRVRFPLISTCPAEEMQ